MVVDGQVIGGVTRCCQWVLVGIGCDVTSNFPATGPLLFRDASAHKRALRNATGHCHSGTERSNCEHGCSLAIAFVLTLASPFRRTSTATLRMAFSSVKLLTAIWLVSLFVESLALTASRPWMGGQGVNMWKLKQLQLQKAESNVPVDIKYNDNAQVVLSGELDDDPEDTFPFKGHWFRQPIDHFNPDITQHFRQRYWINTRHYRPGTGAPVIVLDGGETSGFNRLPFLDKGIVDILAKATGGVGVVLEHR